MEIKQVHVKETIMNSRSTAGAASLLSRCALAAMASMVLLLSPAAQAQHMHGGGGAHIGANSVGAGHNFSGGRHNGFAGRGFRHRGNFAPFVLIGGAGLLYASPYLYYTYPYAYPYAPLQSAPAGAYYCDAAGAYYPYVTTCEGGWTVVPGMPNQAYPVPQQ
jgi:hypothetical protein